MKVLIFGCNGQLGRCLIDQLHGTNYEVIAYGRDLVDIGDLVATKDLVTITKPYAVINASAYTAVDTAENDAEMANHINHIAVKNLAEICAKQGTILVHISTDYVFDGYAASPYMEDAQTHPLGVYGSTKLLGEQTITQVDCQHLIIRTAWLFSEYGNNFLKTMLRLGNERDELSIVGDQTGCPTYAQDLAKAIICALPVLKNDSSLSGLYHYCGNESCTWFDFATVIFGEAKCLGLKVPHALHSIASSDFTTLAHRPKYSVLDNCKIKGTFGIDSSDWRASIPRVLQKIIKG
jgi:dTDP-4-dehydrorhamnose reductase